MHPTVRTTSRRCLALIAVAPTLLLGTAIPGTAAGAAAASAATDSAAQAGTPRNGVCEEGEFCYFYNSDHQGSVSDFTESVGDYGTTQPSCYDFKGAGAGQGLCIKNEAASVWNRTGQTVTVFFNTGFGGATQSFAAGAKQNLNATLKNNNASHRIGAAISRAEVIRRAQTWLNPRVPYSMDKVYQGYRQDCSGYVSMAWNAPAPGYPTNEMWRIGHDIAKSDLQAGDVLLNKAAGADGHVVLFEKWADAAQTAYWGYESTPGDPSGAKYRQISYPYFPGHGTFAPFRYNGIG
ncbi:peptidase inhibitor family I36 protein [Nakamurella aerolata]|uniref:Uncharacterized protein n=1 Tax=Nakamurella aerolata TaxID=1656892 RepID=A0A849ABC7_9ACTN|nr:peptidase inhibitor family I36 protein [Nakamurella aerolata]NNG36973.1 hypothetical protein [Nakamurella aerolata]